MSEEAMETAITSVTPEDIAPNAVFSGSLSLSRSDEKVQSRYLKPSMASCHDHCKYGKKHDSEAISPNLRTFLKNKRAQIQAARPNGEERKLKMSIRPKMVSEFSDKPDLPKPKGPARTKKTVAPGEKKTLLISRDNRQNRAKSTTPREEKKPRVIKRRTWLQPQASRDELDVANLNNPSPAYEADASVHRGSIEENTESAVINLSPASEADFSIVPSSVEEHIESTVNGTTAIDLIDLLPASGVDFSADPASIKKNIDSSVSETTAINLIDLLPASEADFSINPGSVEEHIESTVSGTTAIDLIDHLPASEVDFSADPGSVKKNIDSSISETTAINLIDLLPASEADFSIDPGSVEETIKSTVSGTTAINSIDRSPASEAVAKENTDSSVVPAKIKRKVPPSAVKKLHSTDRKAPHPLKRVDAVARSAIVLKTKTPLVRSISHLKPSRISVARRNQEKNATKSPVTLKFGGVASKPVNASNTTSAPLLRSLSTRRNQDKISRSSGFSKIGIPDAVKTKDTRGKHESKIIKSLHKSSIVGRKLLKPTPTSFSSEAPLDDASILKPGKLRTAKRSTSLKRKDIVDGVANAKPTENRKIEDSESATNEGISKGGYKRGARRALPQDSNVSAPYKLKFRQGKVMDLRCDSIGARRLWFRVGKMASENPNGNSVAWRRSFRKKDAGGSESGPPASDAQIVVLKHQGTEEKKKDGQALFNHVIEETASKLVEARKSKVKALVGAFETVISLQETKPAFVV